MLQVQVMLASGDIDTWEGEDLSVEMVEGYVNITEGERLLAMYATGMWMKFEPRVIGDAHNA